MYPCILCVLYTLTVFGQIHNLYPLLIPFFFLAFFSSTFYIIRYTKSLLYTQRVYVCKSLFFFPSLNVFFSLFSLFQLQKSERLSVKAKEEEEEEEEENNSLALDDAVTWIIAPRGAKKTFFFSIPPPSLFLLFGYASASTPSPNFSSTSFFEISRSKIGTFDAINGMECIVWLWTF